MTSVIVLAIPFAVVFVAVSGQQTWEGFLVGFIVSIAVLWLGQAYNLKIKLHRVHSQIIFLLWYSLRLAIDIFLSSVEVTRMVISPNIMDEIDPAVTKISTQDPDNNEIVTAMSSHGITITPGQLVIDIEKKENETIMFVHNLNARKSVKTIETDQTKRLRLIRKVLGYD